MEVARDIFHLLVNLSMAQLTEKERAALATMKVYFLDQLRPMLADDPMWERVGPYIEGTAVDDD
jgi:hypothetical protein